MPWADQKSIGRTRLLLLGFQKVGRVGMWRKRTEIIRLVFLCMYLQAVRNGKLTPVTYRQGNFEKPQLSKVSWGLNTVIGRSFVQGIQVETMQHFETTSEYCLARYCWQNYTTTQGESDGRQVNKSRISALRPRNACLAKGVLFGGTCVQH